MRTQELRREVGASSSEHVELWNVRLARRFLTRQAFHSGEKFLALASAASEADESNDKQQAACGLRNAGEQEAADFAAWILLAMDVPVGLASGQCSRQCRFRTCRGSAVR